MARELDPIAESPHESRVARTPRCGDAHGESVRIVVVADTHLPRFRAGLARALEAVAAERPDRLLHCGDITDLAALAPFEALAPLDAVAGNNDGGDAVVRFGRRKVVEIGGLRLGLVHGDGARGSTRSRALAAFEREPVGVVLFGHSHAPLCERVADRWLVNPGSLLDRRRESACSFAVLDVAGRAAVPRIVRIAR